jgi:hypothetical protein
MPIGRKLTITKELTIPADRFGRTTKSESLVKNGILIGDKLILDVNTNIRIDGFSARFNDDGYPDVRLSVQPEGCKMGSITVSLKDMDGLSWDLAPEDKPKKEQKEIRRFDVSFNEYTNYGCAWIKPFEKSISINDTEGLVNPLALTTEQIKERKFTDTYSKKIGSAGCKINKEVFGYEVMVYENFNFELTISDGLLYGKLIDMTYRVIILNPYKTNDSETVKDNIKNPEDITPELIKKYLEKKYEKL